MESLLPRERLPRVLNSDDITLNPTDPEPLFAPVGDFNKDGEDDMAISGIYSLEAGVKRYFLLVVAGHVNPIHYDKLFYSEYEQPVFLHRPGTTGEFDPGTQAFSITSCSSCSDGYDFIWNPKKKVLLQQEWEKRRRHYETVQHRPDPTPDSEKADMALRLVGALPDVVAYVGNVKKTKGELGTAARISAEARHNPDRVIIDVYEKKGEAKKIYDSFDVDVASKTIVKRGRKVKTAGGALNTSR